MPFTSVVVMTPSQTLEPVRRCRACCRSLGTQGGTGSSVEQIRRSCHRDTRCWYGRPIRLSRRRAARSCDTDAHRPSEAPLNMNPDRRVGHEPCCDLSLWTVRLDARQRSRLVKKKARRVAARRNLMISQCCGSKFLAQPYWFPHFCGCEADYTLCIRIASGCRTGCSTGTPLC